MLKLIEKFLPCEKRMAEQRAARQAAVCSIAEKTEALREACGEVEGYNTPWDFVPKAKFDARHLINVK
ncbi:MAG TPA: hypothetical protein PLW48_03775 [Alphaproteobacteria bacterium]|nr:hypothetical protein [Rhodospirillaceae bacterium]HRJ66231.1 hypothetical protein [Alphaproteobacteria bacterium]